MADHSFEGEIILIFCFIVFVFVIGGSFAADMGEKHIEAEALAESGITNNWLFMGDSLSNMISWIPEEIFMLIIMPLILLMLYIVIITASDLLPSWISG